ncbi:MAG: potassium-dependent mechanosensitive channel [Methyloprofundus sp.]|nr:MAG: potassium-dependent mechanosensitive channel [Methyloprofundus sp.]
MFFKVLIACSLLILSTGVYCQSDLNIGSHQATVKNSAKDEITLPMPGALISKWWDYFNVDDKTLLQRIHKAKQQYAAQLNSLTKPQQQSAQQYLDRLIKNLLTLNKLALKAKKSPKVSVISAKDSYSIDEWLDISDQLRVQQSEFIDNQNHIDTQISALQEAESQLDIKQLEYAKMTAGSGEKLVFGLRIMFDHSAIAVSAERLKLSKNTLKKQSKRINKLIELNKLASTRLQVSSQYLVQLNVRIVQLQQQLTQKQQALHTKLADSMGIIENSPTSSSQARMHDQEVIKLMIRQNALSLELASLQAKKDLASLLSATDKHRNDDIQKHLQHWQDLMTASREKSLIWYKDSVNELTRIQDEILQQKNANKANINLQKSLAQRQQLTQGSLVELRHLDIRQNTLDALSQEVDKRFLLHSGKLAYLLGWSSSQAEDFLDGMISWAKLPLFSIGSTPVTAAGLARVVLIIAIAGLLSSLLRRSMDRLAERIEANDKGVSVFYTVGRLMHYVILLLGIIIALSSIGLDFSSLTLVAGALSVGIGFGLQSIVNNFVSGLILLFEGTIKVGDFIELDSNVMGTVREINVRNTQVNTPDNVDVIVPNSLLVSGKVTNWTLREENRRIHVPFGVAYGSDKELVKKAVLEAASRVPYTCKPRHRHKNRDAIQCWLVKFGDSSLDFELVVWINREAVRKPPMVYAAYLWEIESSLREYGIEIPFPQRDLHLRSGFEKKPYEPSSLMYK